MHMVWKRRRLLTLDGIRVILMQHRDLRVREEPIIVVARLVGAPVMVLTIADCAGRAARRWTLN